MEWEKKMKITCDYIANKWYSIYAEVKIVLESLYYWAYQS